MVSVTICSDFEAQENKICHCFHFSPSIFHKVMGPDAMILIFWMLSFFTLLFHLHQKALKFFFTFCHCGGITCISEVIYISPSNLDFNLSSIQPCISHDILCICGLPWWLSGKESTYNAGAAGNMGSVVGQKNPLKESMAAHSSIFAWRIS